MPRSKKGVPAQVWSFGTCCDALFNSLTDLPSSQFYVDENDVLYLTVGSMPVQHAVPEATAWVDRAVIFCPFCGARLQDPQEVQRRAQDGA